MYTLFQRGNRFLFFLATYSVRHSNISISSESTIQIRETHALYTHARRTSNSSYFAWKRRICNCRLATKMQMHVIITRRASSENLDAKELRFLSLGRSSSSCNETPRIVAGGRPKSGGRRLENKKKKKKIKKQTETKKRIRRWRVEKDPAKIMKLLYAKMYFSRGRCSRESKKRACCTLTNSRWYLTLFIRFSLEFASTTRAIFCTLPPPLIGGLNSGVIALKITPAWRFPFATLV